MRTNVVRTWTSFPKQTLQNCRYSSSCNYRRIIADHDNTVNAFVNTSPPPPSQHAQSLPLLGLTVALKDNISTSFLPTTCASAMLKDYVSPFDATVVRLLKNAGADIIGKTNCDEFGMGSLNIHSIHGPVKNPARSASHDLARSAGGSSGGSAAAVAAGMCDVALGTDTGGSVRIPASYCGVIGFKPSYGLISRWGVVSYADSLDCVGILASNVSKVKTIFDLLAVHDELDPTAAPDELRILADQRVQKQLPLSGRPPSLKGLKIGIPQEYFPSELSADVISPVRDVVNLLRERGSTILPVSLPSTSFALSSYYVLASAEASSNLARYDGIQYGTYVKPGTGIDLGNTSQVYAQSRSSGFGPEVQKRILLGTYSLSADAFNNYFLQAQRVRQLIKNEFNAVFNAPNYYSDSPIENPQGIDILVHPTATQTAPLLTDSSRSELNAYVQDVLTVPASLAGLPALSIPLKAKPGSGSDTRWPVGVSLVGQWGMDRLILAVGDALHSQLTNPDKPGNI